MNYGQLKTAVAAWANRSDLTSLLDTFRDLAEQRIYFGSPDLAVDQMRLAAMLTTVTPFDGTLPADCLQIERLSASLSSTVKRTLEYRSLEQIAPHQVITGQPSFYSVQGSAVIFGPTFSYDVELLYYARFTTPSADADTNYLLTNASGVYLYAMLIEIGQYLKDGDLMATAGKLFATAQNALLDNDKQGQKSGSTLSIRTDMRVRA
jgi:hypothetical protein